VAVLPEAAVLLCGCEAIVTAVHCAKPSNEDKIVKRKTILMNAKYFLPFINK
jgi:hypothetical protein